VSGFWALGETWLLDTVGGTFERWGRSRSPGVLALLWVTILVKLVAAVVPLLALYELVPASTRRAVRLLAWADGLILAAYGFVLTAAGLAIQAGIVAASAHADHRALAWHAYLWDPWFLVWGVLVVVALGRGAAD
jgi:hypothetical protein